MYGRGDDEVGSGVSRGKNGKVRRSPGFAGAFARGDESAQRSGVGELARTGANGCTVSTSWGRWFEPSTAHGKALHQGLPCTSEQPVAGISLATVFARRRGGPRVARQA